MSATLGFIIGGGLCYFLGFFTPILFKSAERWLDRVDRWLDARRLDRYLRKQSDGTWRA